MSIPWTNGYGKYCVFVNFDGSIQKCHHCQQPGHIEKDCPTKEKMNEALVIAEQVAEPSLPLSATIIDQQPPAKKNRYKLKSTRPTHRSTPYKQKTTADSTIEDKRDESSGSDSDEENETKYDADNVNATTFLEFCFPGWTEIEDGPVEETAESKVDF